MMPSRIAQPWLTPLTLRTGGELKNDPDDFEVEEIPAYEPSGEGKHLYLWIEKRDVSADHLQVHLSRTLGCARLDIGMAGLKDRRAVTRQWVSVPAKCETNLGQVDIDGIRVLKSSRHRNKLRTGHLKGNRFRIMLRNAIPDSLPAAETIAAHLRSQGMPNFYGDQRFGLDGETLSLGHALLTGAKSSRDVPPAKRRFLVRLAYSAMQSELFNETLAGRMRDGLLHQVLAGDVMQVTASGGVFIVDNAEIEQARFQANETTITGPMFGPDMKAPSGAVAEREAAVLQRWQLSAGDFERSRKFTSGTRRPYLVRLDDLQIELIESSLRLEFSLPSGAYATSVVREFTKA
jgi:tRNA pseudouridine13 synthase